MISIWGIFFSEKMKMIDFQNSDFWKLLRLPSTQFSKFNYFLWVCCFLGKNLSNFEPLVWKLHNPYCHSVVTWRDKTQPTQKVAFLLDWTSSRSALELLFPIEFCLLTFVFNLTPVSICNLISIFQERKIHLLET